MLRWAKSDEKNVEEEEPKQERGDDSKNKNSGEPVDGNEDAVVEDAAADKLISKPTIVDDDTPSAAAPDVPAIARRRERCSRRSQRRNYKRASQRSNPAGTRRGCKGCEWPSFKLYLFRYPNHRQDVPRPTRQILDYLLPIDSGTWFRTCFLIIVSFKFIFFVLDNNFKVGA